MAVKRLPTSRMSNAYTPWVRKNRRGVAIIQPSISLGYTGYNQWGIYRSTSGLAAWNANTVEWTKIGGYPFGNYDLITCVEGDANTFGTVYVGFSGSGWATTTMLRLDQGRRQDASARSDTGQFLPQIFVAY